MKYKDGLVEVLAKHQTDNHFAHIAIVSAHEWQFGITAMTSLKGMQNAIQVIFRFGSIIHSAPFARHTHTKVYFYSFIYLL